MLLLFFYFFVIFFFHFAENVKRKQISAELTSWGPHSSLERERKIRRRSFVSCSSRSRAVTAKKCTKKCATRAKLLFLINRFLFSLSRCRRHRPCESSLMNLLNGSEPP